MNTRYQKWLVITWVIILVESVALIFVSGGDSILTASVEDIHNQTAVEVTSKQTNIQENTTPTQDNAQGGTSSGQANGNTPTQLPGQAKPQATSSNPTQAQTTTAQPQTPPTGEPEKTPSVPETTTTQESDPEPVVQTAPLGPTVATDDEYFEPTDDTPSPEEGISEDQTDVTTPPQATTPTVDNAPPVADTEAPVIQLPSQGPVNFDQGTTIDLSGQVTSPQNTQANNDSQETQQQPPLIDEEENTTTEVEEAVPAPPGPLAIDTGYPVETVASEKDNLEPEPKIYQQEDFLVLEETDELRITRYITNQDDTVASVRSAYMQMFTVPEDDTGLIDILDAASGEILGDFFSLAPDTVIEIHHTRILPSPIDLYPVLPVGQEIQLLVDIGKQKAGSIGRILRISYDDPLDPVYVTEFGVGNGNADVTRTLELHHGQKGKNWEIVTSFFEPEEKIDDWFIDDLETLYTDDGFDVLVENDYEIIAHYTVQNGGNLGGVKKKLLGALEVRDDQYIDFVGYYPGGNSIERGSELSKGQVLYVVLTKKKYTPVTDEDIIGAWWYDEVGTEYAAHEVELREDGVVDYFPHKVVWGIVNERMITRSQETGLIDSIAYGDTLSSDLFGYSLQEGKSQYILSKNAPEFLGSIFDYSYEEFTDPLSGEVSRVLKKKRKAFKIHNLAERKNVSFITKEDRRQFRRNMRSKIKGVAPVSQEFQGEGYLQADGRQVGYLELMADLTVADNFVVGATDEASWMHLGDTDRTYIETIELLIPKLPDQNGVVICPGAQSQEEILGEGACSEKIELSIGKIQSKNYRLVELDDPDYWHVRALDPELFSTGGAGWNFPNVTGKISWFDAYDVDGDGIEEGASENYSGTWIDKMGNGDAFTVNTSPTYNATGGFGSRPVVQLNGSGYFHVNTGGLLADQITVFMVHDMANNNTNKGLFSFYTTSNLNAGVFSWTNDRYLYIWKGESPYPYIRHDAGSGAGNEWRNENITTLNVDIQQTGNSELFIDGTAKTVTRVNSSGVLTDGSYDIGSWNYAYGSTNQGPQEYEGNIAEVIIYNGVLSQSDQQDVECYLANKWGVEPNINCAPNELSLSSTNVRAGRPTGTIVGGLSTLDVNSGNTFTYTLSCSTAGNDDSHFSISGSNLLTGEIFDLGSPSDSNSDNIYEICIRTTDNNSEYLDRNFSIQVIVDPQDLGSLVLHLDAQDVDGDGLLYFQDPSGEPINGNTITSFTDKATGVGGSNNATQWTNNNRAIYSSTGMDGFPGVRFDGNNDYYTIANNAAINTGSNYPQRSIATVIRTGSDVSSLQVIYEEGGGSRGYNYMIGLGELWAGVWNNVEWDSGHQYKSVSLGAIEPNSTYFAVMVQDSSSGSDTTNTLKFYKSGNLIATVDHVDPQRGHSGSIQLGRAGGSVYAHNNQSSGTGSYFDGYVGEMLLYNTALTQSDVDDLQDYFVQRWGINQSPTDIGLSANSIAEDSPSNTTIGTLTTSDPDDTSFTYSLVSGTGSEDNARFTISGDELRLNFVPDYENPLDLGDTAGNNTYSIRISTNDGNGNTYEEVFIITIIDTNGLAPTDISLSASTIAENNTTGAVIGTLSTTDSDSSSFTYTLVSGSGDDDNSHFSITGGQLQTTTVFDYEFPIDQGNTAGNNTYSIRIRTTDDTNNIFEEALLITVTDVNAAPTGVTIDNDILLEGLPTLTLVGNLSATDDGEDNPVSYTYTESCSVPGADNSHFEIDNVKLRSSTVFNVASPVDANGDNIYEVCVRVSDGDTTYDQLLYIFVVTNDTTPPIPSNFTPDDDEVGVLETSNLVISFNESIAKGSGYINIHRSSDDALIEAIDVTSGNVTIIGSSFTDLVVDPTSDFDAGETYYILIDSGAIEDVSGNDWPGISTPGDWDFTTAGSLDVEIVDAAGIPINSPVIDFGTTEFSFVSQTQQGILGTTGARVRVQNDRANPNWTVSIQPASGQTAWDAGGGNTMSYDGNGSSGLLSIDPSVASMSRVGGGSISGINLGSATDFSVASIITIASSTGGPTFASFDFIDIDVSQVIPAGSQGGMYSIELQLTSI